MKALAQILSLVAASFASILARVVVLPLFPYDSYFSVVAVTFAAFSVYLLVYLQGRHMARMQGVRLELRPAERRDPTRLLTLLFVGTLVVTLPQGLTGGSTFDLSLLGMLLLLVVETMVPVHVFLAVANRTTPPPTPS